MRLISDALRKYSAFLAIVIIGPLLGGCSLFGPSEPPPGPGQQVNPAASDPLRPGDSITVDFSGTVNPLHPVQTEVKGDGTIHLEFIGDVQAEGKTPGQLEKAIQNAYVPAYYTHMSVTVTPSARFFYVEGEVNGGGGGGGRIMYSGPITVTRAIASAGDFNPFADRKHVKLYRVNATSAITINCVKALDDPRLDLPVYPGDKIVVKRRYY